MDAIILRGSSIELQDVEAALRAFYKNSRSISVKRSEDSAKSQASTTSSAATDNDLSGSDDIVISRLTPRSSSHGPTAEEFDDLQNLLDKISHKLDQKEAECRESNEKASKALATVQTFHAQQKEMFEEFRILRERYDEQKNLLQDTLWKQCAAFHPELNAIPPMQPDDFPETDTEVGDFTVGGVLGEGQFATVLKCERKGDPVELALKVINKDKILSFNSLRHVSNEIDILKRFNCQHIIRIKDILQTQQKLYIVTEKGGLDLFEFFDEHPDGVSEEWAREIISCVLRGVHYIHRQGICHRDLKPENILVSFDKSSGKCIDLKLCDFGLASTFDPNTYLNDFCGSPGFFAPEMIIRGSYYGDKADIWSCGCILLELTLGHERFCDTWMTAYDYEILQDKAVFAKEIRQCIEKLSDSLNFSHELNEFIVKFLRLRSSLRPSIGDICRDVWLGDLAMDGDGSQSPSAKVNLTDFNTANRHSIYGIEDAITNTGVDPDIIRSSFNSLSERERKLYQDHSESHPTEKHLHLPPIEPPTPNMSAARKILKKGEQLVTSTQHQDMDRWSVSSGGESPTLDTGIPSPYAPHLDSPVMRMGKMIKPSLPDVGEVSELEDESEKFGNTNTRGSITSDSSNKSTKFLSSESTKSIYEEASSKVRRGSNAAERAAQVALELAANVDEDMRRDSLDLRISTRTHNKLIAAGERERLPEAIASPRTPRGADYATDGESNKSAASGKAGKW